MPLVGVEWLTLVDGRKCIESGRGRNLDDARERRCARPGIRGCADEAMPTATVTAPADVKRVFGETRCAVGNLEHRLSKRKQVLNLQLRKLSTSLGGERLMTCKPVAPYCRMHRIEGRRHKRLTLDRCLPLADRHLARTQGREGHLRVNTML